MGYTGMENTVMIQFLSFLKHSGNDREKAIKKLACNLFGDPAKQTVSDEGLEWTRKTADKIYPNVTGQ